MMRIVLVLALLLAGLGAAQAAESSYSSGPKDMRVDISLPDGQPPKGLILVLHTSGGHQTADADYARKLVAEGFATAVPHFLDAYGITPKQRQRSWTQFRTALFEDFKRIADETAARLKIDRGRVAAVGFSNGGYWAAYLAGKGAVRAGVCYYGALTEAGNDRDLDNLAGAFSGNSSPILVLHGTADETVNVGAARRLERRLQRPDAQFVIYEGAGHRFEREGGAANRKAAADAWKRTLEFLAR